MAVICFRRRSRGAFIWRRLLFIFVAFVVSTALSHVFNKGNGAFVNHFQDLNTVNKNTDGIDRLVVLRHLASAPYSDTDQQADEENNTEVNLTCTPPTIHEFPTDYFSKEQREKGAIILHACCVIYMFLALAIVCDDYFVSSLEKICERLNFSEDVAGATFMAAGSSAPELFTSLIGVFVAKGDVGVGTIVGSAVFNILVIIGICGVFAGQVVSLSWWPLFRDTAVYMLAVVILVLVIYDGQVVWFEALIMLIMYAGYIFLMWLNPKIYVKIERRAEKRKNAKRKDVCNNKTAIQLEQVAPLNAPAKEDTANGGEKTPVVDTEEYNDSPKRLTFSDAGLRLMLSKQFPARTRLRTACWLIITEKQMMERDPEYVDYLRRSNSSNGAIRKQSMDNGNRTPQESTLTTQIPVSPKKAALNSSDSTIPVSNHSVPDEDLEADMGSRRATLEALGIEPEGLCHVPNGWWEIIKWLICLPLCTLMFFTIPDCRRKKFERWYLFTFIMSIIWIALFSYVMVWMVALIGFTLRIPDTIMGLTFLAAGTSVPDAMASLIVAKQGLGDMAVSNSIGSNVFDILLGLALPWFIKTTMVSYGTSVRINSNGLIYSVLLLFATVAATITTIHFSRWKLTKKVGYLLFVFYVVFLSLSIMVELNIFGYVNPPICDL